MGAANIVWFAKISVKISFVLLIALVVCVNFYSYSMLTRLVYSYEWLFAKTPLLSTYAGEVYIPPPVSRAFQWLHSLKIGVLAVIAMFYNDGFPNFAGKYHWERNELAYCNVGEDTLHREQSSKDPRLQCHVYAIIPLMFVRTELFSVEPPIVKFHGFMAPNRVAEFVREVRTKTMEASTVSVRDGLEQGIWQDSIVVNNTFVHPFSTPSLTAQFIYIQQRINAFNFGQSEQFNVKKYEVGGHYAPHLDVLITKETEIPNNRIATFMLILQSAELGGGTVFPDAGFTFVPKAGDALLWLNLLPDSSTALHSMHGACPILEGSKIAITMWIQSLGQELRLPSPRHFGLHYDYKYLVQPSKSRPGAKLWE